MEAQSLENTELLMRFSTDLVTFGDWYTDDVISLLRSSFSALSLLPSLFSPARCLVMLYDVYSAVSFQIFFSHPLAVASLRSGSVDVILHRRPINDDNAGLSYLLSNFLFSFLISLHSPLLHSNMYSRTHTHYTHFHSHIHPHRAERGLE